MLQAQHTKNVVPNPHPTPTPKVDATATPTNTPLPSTETSYTTTQRITLTLAGQRIAVREIVEDDSGIVTSTSIHYFLTHHLGSSSQMVHHTSNAVVANSTARHTPFGDYRTTPTANDTDLGFTGHRENRSIGLTYMNARYYVGGIGRFASADTIVPDPTNPQNFNRFAYVLNNPINLVGPSGHMAQEAIADIDGDAVTAGSATFLLLVQQLYANGVNINWGRISLWNQGINIQEMWAQHDANQEGNNSSTNSQDDLQDLAGNVSGSPNDFDPNDNGDFVPLSQRQSGGTGANYDRNNGQGVYALVDKQGNVVYVGRGDVHSRISAHARSSSKSQYDSVIIANNNLSYAEARGLEQLLMNQYGGPQGGQLLNRINGISRLNPNLNQYLNAGKPLLNDALSIVTP